MSNPSGPEERGPAFHSRNLDGARAPKRSFAKLSKSKVKDTDLHDVSVRMSAVVASMVGALMGAPLGFCMMEQYDFGVWAIPACMAGMGLLVSTSQLAPRWQRIWVREGPLEPFRFQYPAHEGVLLPGVVGYAGPL